MPPTRTADIHLRSLQRHKEKLRLLTYPMALAQKGASVPLVQDGAAEERGRALEHRRWVRDADELCIATVKRSNNINHINQYVATYKLDDPQWRPLLLPEVHVLPRRVSAAPPEGEEEEAVAAAPAQKDVFIDYNKMTSIELMSRHANYALRHLVQKGHAMYFVNFAQHSIVEMRGCVEQTHIRCAFGVRGERLRTHLIHVGPLDLRDVLHLDKRSLEVSFDFAKPHVRRGVVAVSTVEGYGTWFQRKPMLWQRTRRIGALQSQMGAYDYDLCDPEAVGRTRSCQVSLLAPHLRFLGGVTGGGAEAVGLVASSQVAQNEKLYLGQFEAPAIAAVDAVQQLAHRAALHHQLVRPPPPAAAESAGAEAQRRLAGMEQLLPVSWLTRTPPPYVPLEADLPFKIQLSKPAVLPAATATEAPIVYPTGGTVGSPFVDGVPLSLMEYNVHQGVDHYVFDDAPSARPLKWWNQKSNLPYSGYMYFMRSGLLDHVRAAEKLQNPLAPPERAFQRSTATTQQHKRRRRTTATERHHANANRKEEEGDELQRELGEVWEVVTGELRGHDDVSLQEEEALAATDEVVERAARHRRPLHSLVQPSATAQRRLDAHARTAPPGAAAAAAAAAAEEEQEEEAGPEKKKKKTASTRRTQGTRKRSASTAVLRRRLLALKKMNEAADTTKK